jgi:hypothetical protein
MLPSALRGQQIHAIIERFKNGADDTTNLYFRDLMLATVADLEAMAAKLEAGEPIDPPAERAA